MVLPSNKDISQQQHGRRQQQQQQQHYLKQQHQHQQQQQHKRPLHTPSSVTVTVTGTGTVTRPTAASTISQQAPLPPWRSNNPQKRFLVFVELLMKYLDRVDAIENGNLKIQAKKIIAECVKKNREGHPKFSPLQKVVEIHLRKVIGNNHWLRLCQVMTRLRSPLPPSSLVPLPVPCSSGSSVAGARARGVDDGDGDDGIIPITTYSNTTALPGRGVVCTTSLRANDNNNEVREVSAGEDDTTVEADDDTDVEDSPLICEV
jgi:hypothetical protein